MRNKCKIFVLSLLAFLNCGSSALEKGSNVQKSILGEAERKTLNNFTKDKNKNPKIKKSDLKDVFISAGFASLLIAPKIIAHELLFMGDSLLDYSFYSEECYKDFNYLRKMRKIKTNTISSNRLGLTLKGYELNKSSKPVKNVCILFHGNADDSQMDIYSALCSDTKDTIFVSFEYPTRRYFGTGETLWWINEEDLKKYADDVYDFVKSTYVDNKGDNEKPRIIARGWSLGGFPASYLASKEDVSCVILDSPVSLPAIVGKVPSYALFGYELNSIKNILNLNRKNPLDLVMRSGGETDFLSLDKTISYELGKKIEPSEVPKELKQKLEGKNVNLKLFRIGKYGDHKTYGPAFNAGDAICQVYGR